MSDLIDKSIDILGREDYVNHLKEVIDASCSNHESNSICLYGSWGSGKSFVLNLLEKELAKDKYLVIKYDSWEKDFYDEPLVGILYSFAVQLNQLLRTKHTIDGLTNDILLGALATFSEVLGAITKKAIGIDVPKELAKAYKRISAARRKKEIQTTFNNNLGIEEAKLQVRKELGEISSKVNVVLLVDEIDRCLPDYSLKVLERLHHFIFGIQNLQSITALDKKQLNNIVCHYYGEKADIDRYLQKFFNINVFLNGGNFNLSFKERYSTYVNLFNKNTFSFITDSDIGSFITCLYSSKNARFIDQSIEKAYLVHNLLSFEHKEEKTVMILELLISFLSLLGKNKAVFTEYFGKDICNPSLFNQRSRNPDKLEMYDMICKIDDARNCIRRANDIDIMFVIQDIWSFVWFAIIANGKEPATRNYSFGCNYQGGMYNNQLRDIFDFSVTFAKKAFSI